MKELDEFKELYVWNYFKEIKNIVLGRVKLPYGDDTVNINKNEEEIDEKMLAVIRELLSSNFLDNEEKYGLTSMSGENKKIKLKNLLILYYTALLFDNVKLLKKCIKNDLFFLGNIRYDVPVCLLSTEISSKFNEDEYVEKLKTGGYAIVIELFYANISKIEGLEREQFIQKFTNVLKGKGYIWGNPAFTKDLLDVYDEDILVKRDLVDIFNKYYRYVYKADLKDKEINSRFNELERASFNFPENFPFSKMFSIFTNEELIDFRYHLNEFFDISDINLLKRVRKLWIRDKSIINFGISRHPIFYQMFDDETIMAFSNEALRKLDFGWDILYSAFQEGISMKRVAKFLKEWKGSIRDDGFQIGGIISNPKFWETFTDEEVAQMDILRYCHEIMEFLRGESLDKNSIFAKKNKR